MEWADDGLQQIQVAVGHAAEVTRPSRPAPQAPPEADLAEGLRALAAEFDRHQDVDSATSSAAFLLGITGMLSAGARSAGMEVHVLSDNALTHRPMDLTSDEKAAVHSAIAEVMASSG